MCRRTCGVAGVLILIGLASGALGQDRPGLSPQGRRERLQMIRGIVQTLEATLLGSREEPAVLPKEPSLLYADNVRELSDSSLWVWQHQGRPVGVTAVEWHLGDQDAGMWTFEFTSLSPAALKLSLPDRSWTSASDVAVARAVPNAPAVAATRTVRQVQMKQIAERFKAAELHRQEGRIELRRLAAPVFRQSEATAGDGAIFVFANGTNPEVVLSISTLEGPRDSVWAYTLGALCAEECVASLDDREVWQETRFTKPGARPTYVNGRLPSPPEAK